MLPPRSDLGLKRALCAASLVLGLGASIAAADVLSDAEMKSFLVQCIGTDGAGKPVLPSPERPRCPGGGFQTVSDRAEWRKHDWGEVGRTGSPGLGDQASDSVLESRGGREVIVQTFDFGNRKGDLFGRFDKGGGDGGDLLTLIDGSAWGFFTEDGGGGEQWFVAERCRDDPAPSARLKAWLFFGNDVKRDVWTEAVARLKIARSARECPTRFNSAFTRYLMDTVEVPFRVLDGSKAPHLNRRRIETVVSEHFGGENIARADHLERFFFGRGLGKYRWERWEQLSRTRLSGAGERADGMARSGKCMPIRHSDSPGEGWVMVDCRTWTTLVRQERPWSVRDFGWPGRVLEDVR